MENIIDNLSVVMPFFLISWGVFFGSTLWKPQRFRNSIGAPVAWYYWPSAVITMAIVGYIEEIIFRGFLYKAIEKDNVKQAIIISAVTFGAGHIVNLLTGHGSVDTILQMAYAIAIGFAFAMFFYKSGSLIPCIITHSIVNLTSKFSNHNISEQAESYWNYGATVFIILVAGAYALYLRKVNLPEDEKTDLQV